MTVEEILVRTWLIGGLLAALAALLPRPRVAPKVSAAVLVAFAVALVVVLLPACGRMDEGWTVAGAFVRLVAGVPTILFAAACWAIAVARRERARREEERATAIPRCPKCGAETPAGTRFCPMCGLGLDAGSDGTARQGEPPRVSGTEPVDRRAEHAHETSA